MGLQKINTVKRTYTKPQHKAWETRRRLAASKSKKSGTTQEEYEIDHLLCILPENNGEFRGLVKWTGYEDPTWEPVPNLPAAVVRDYYKTQQKRIVAGTFNQEGTYREHVVSDKPSKIRANQLFAQSSADVSGDGAVLYLDGAHQKTTMSLVSYGVDKVRKLVAINCSAEIHRTMLNRSVPNCFPVRAWVHDHLQGETTLLASCWLDYCCTFAGNKTCKPKRDIILLLQKNLLRHGSVFAVTFCLRDNRHPLPEQGKKIHRWLTQTARNHQYRLCLKEKLSYRFAMLFLLYSVEKK